MLLIVGIVEGAKIREIRKEKEEKICVAHLEAHVVEDIWVLGLLNKLAV